MNLAFKDIKDVFTAAGVPELDRLPQEVSEKAKFAKLFRALSTYYQAAQIQGFSWDKKVYEPAQENQADEEPVELEMTKDEYEILLQRYKELRTGPAPSEENEEVTFSIDPYLTELNTGVIDNDYMNSRFEKWKKQLGQPDISPEELEKTLEELHKSFAFLSQEDQKYANLFLHDVQTGDIVLQNGVTFRDYIAMYRNNAQKEEVHRLHEYLGVSEQLMLNFLDSDVTRDNLNAYGRFDALKGTVLKEKAQAYFTQIDGKKMPMFRVNNRVNEFLTDFILSGGKNLPDPKDQK